MLKQTSASPFWQCYCRTKQHTFRKSTATADLEQAKLVALEWFFQIKQQGGNKGSLKRINFNTLCENYIKTVIGAAKQRYHRETIDRHFKPYFAEFTDIRKITDGEIENYLVQRRGKTKQEPTPQTPDRECDAVAKGHLGSAIRVGAGAVAAVPVVRYRVTGSKVFAGSPTDDPKSSIIWEAFKADSEAQRTNRRDDLAKQRDALIGQIRRGAQAQADEGDDSQVSEDPRIAADGAVAIQ